VRDASAARPEVPCQCARRDAPFQAEQSQLAAGPSSRLCHGCHNTRYHGRMGAPKVGTDRA
jgi:hypothetical protein